MGKVLCYDCCQQIVAENVEILKKNRIRIGIQFAMMIAGMILGAIVAAESGGLGSILLGMAVGGVLLSAAKLFLPSFLAAFKLLFSGDMDNMVAAIFFIVIQTIVILFKCVVGSITKIVQYTIYLIHTSKCIDSDSQCLEPV